LDGTFTDLVGGLVDLTWIEPLMSSHWVYLALFLFCAIDAFLPLVPSESLVITLGAFAAATGSPNVLLLVVCAAAGAFAGDNVSRLIGRTIGVRFFARPGRNERRLKTFRWVKRVLDQRGGVIIVVARYIPGGRTAVTVTAGAVGYPLRRFLLFALIAAVSWALYSAIIGYVGGHAFEDDPLLGAAVGIGLAMTITAAVELARYLRARAQTRRESMHHGSQAEAQLTAQSKLDNDQ
jgi:membrane-associated protein